MLGDLFKSLILVVFALANPWLDFVSPVWGYIYAHISSGDFNAASPVNWLEAAYQIKCAQNIVIKTQHKTARLHVKI